MKKGASVLIHMLGSDNLDLATVMAGEASERFAGDHWEPGPDGLPLLKGVTAWLQATVVDVMEVEFAAAVAVRITGGGLGPEQPALVYHGRSYQRATPLG